MGAGMPLPGKAGTSRLESQRHSFEDIVAFRAAMELPLSLCFPAHIAVGFYSTEKRWLKIFSNLFICCNEALPIAFSMNTHKWQR